mmetsp:Transcript_115103/g.223616  ORF Transcript_115103/g.223616 Transcript_115103/m.223616 type:complete len:415 (+) Transcript_115103:78-1322(+)
MALGSGLLNFLGGSSAGDKRGCFGDVNSKILDISAVCHEHRSLEVSQGERVFFSLKDMRSQDSEKIESMGSPCTLHQVDVDTVLLLRVWASWDDTPNRGPEISSSDLRNVGELRIPLDRLVCHCQSMLYQTWLTLDAPSHTQASAGYSDEITNLEQKIADGAEQLLRPRVCLSICKTADLGASGKLLLSPDADPDARERQWGPLLRSQQQHAIMSTAMHTQSLQGDDSSDAAARLQELRNRVKTQTKDIEDVQRELQETEDRLATTRGPPHRNRDCAGDRSVPEGPGGTVAKEAQLEQLRAANAKQKAQIETLRVEVENVRQEANSKIDGANERIRSLRRERDEHQANADRATEEAKQLTQQTEELADETRQLEEHKRALLRIVDELHQTCETAGLQASRRSIDSITANFSRPT